jgi:hypothetical protein
VQMAMQDAIAMFFSHYQDFTFHISIRQFLISISNCKRLNRPRIAAKHDSKSASVSAKSTVVWKILEKRGQKRRAGNDLVLKVLVGYIFSSNC